eukprot:11921967-Heterocapsa_arctica.AAC.1
MACQGRALNSIGPQASMPTAFPVPIFLMIFQRSRGSSGLISGRSLTQSYEIITSLECDPVQRSDHLS